MSKEEDKREKALLEFLEGIKVNVLEPEPIDPAENVIELAWSKPVFARTTLQKYLYQELVGLAVVVDENLSEQQIFGQMSALVRKAKKTVVADDDCEKIEQLLHFMYQEMGFSNTKEHRFNTNSLLIDRVLRDKKGMPVSLGAVLLYLASIFDLPLYPVNFPTQFLVKAETRTETGKLQVRYLNPLNGLEVSRNEMEKWLEGEMGFGTEVSREMLKTAEPEALSARLEAVLKMALTAEGKYETALRVIERRLVTDPDEPYEIRDRGMVLASMGCYQAALEDLSYFIDQCPDDPSANLLKMEMAGLEQKSREHVLH